MKKEYRNKLITTGTMLVLLLIVAIVGGYIEDFGTGSSASTNSIGKTDIVIEVIDSKGESTTYELATDEEYLRLAMEEAEGLEFSGHDSMYGLILDTVNEDTVDEESGTTWTIKVNGEECKNGIDREPVEEGDHFQIVYTK